MDIGEKIKQIRKEKKMSQKELADILGVKHPTVAYFESRGNTITIEQCIRIATALGVSAQSLLFDDIDYQETPNSKELERLLIAKNKENEDLKEEIETLKKKIEHQNIDAFTGILIAFFNALQNSDMNKETIDNLKKKLSKTPTKDA